MKLLSDYSKGKRALIVLGIATVCLGVAGLINCYLAVAWWSFLIGGVIRIMRGLLPIALIGLGVLVMWASRTGKLHEWLHAPAKTGVHRSLTDRRILGVCGGIAQSRDMDSMPIRLAVLFLLIAFPLFTTAAYGVAALIMQPE